MDYRYLNTINSPSDLKALPREALPEVCAELRDFIVSELSHNPGHLGSSLGVIELTVALHYVFDTPYDRLVWDVGHQAYAHKILTGRRDAFHTNRQFGGLAPFPTPAESEYDTCVSGHASNSISVALGMQVADSLLPESGAEGASAGRRRKVVAVIGDGAMTGGLAFEGLNNASMDKNDLLIVLNDNNMAIDPIKGGFTQYLVDLTTSPRYNKLRWWGYQALVKLHLMSDHKRAKLLRFNNNLKTTLTKQPNNIFQGLNIRYFGPADGHDVIGLVRILSEIKNYKGPKVLHIVTQKGKGYAPAEADQTVWHAPGEFDVETGERFADKQSLNSQPSTPTSPLWQEVFGQTLLELAEKDKRIMGVTPAMPSGCSMTIMQKQLPERVFDVGIAEGHAVTFSAGLAKEGAVPFCNIYSSFLQRAYDNIIHDVAIGKMHVVFCIDRAGIVGNDGATHHGLLDLAYLRPIPNIRIAAPMTATDLRQMMAMAVDMEGPVAIRYPRGRSKDRELPPVECGKAVCLRDRFAEKAKTASLKEQRRVCVLSIGAIGNTVEEALNSRNELSGVGHYNMRWLKPLDTETVCAVAENYDTIVTVEDGMISGGLGSAVLETVDTRKVRVVRLGVDDRFVTHGSTAELMHMLHLDAEGIAESLIKLRVEC